MLGLRGSRPQIAQARRNRFRVEHDIIEAGVLACGGHPLHGDVVGAVATDVAHRTADVDAAADIVPGPLQDRADLGQDERDQGHDVKTAVKHLEAALLGHAEEALQSPEQPPGQLGVVIARHLMDARGVAASVACALRVGRAEGHGDLAHLDPLQADDPPAVVAEVAVDRRGTYRAPHGAVQIQRRRHDLGVGRRRVQIDVGDAVRLPDGERAVGGAKIESDPDHAAPLPGMSLRLLYLDLPDAPSGRAGPGAVEPRRLPHAGVRRRVAEAACAPLTSRRFTSYPAVPARMVKLVDTLGSGSSGRKAVEVRVLFRAT